MRASLWSTNCVVPCAECTLGPKNGHRVACASAETAQCLRFQNPRITDANTQDSDSGGMQADPNLVCQYQVRCLLYN